jgi:hypothetical protein
MDSIVLSDPTHASDVTINDEREYVPAVLGADRGRMYQLQSGFVLFA